MKKVNNFYAKNGLTPYQVGIGSSVLGVIVMLFSSVVYYLPASDGIPEHSDNVALVPAIIVFCIGFILMIYGLIKGRCPACGCLFDPRRGGKYCSRCGENTDTIDYWKD